MTKTYGKMTNRRAYQVGVAVGKASRQAEIDDILAALNHVEELKADRDAMKPWAMFYRDGATIGEIQAACSGSVYNYTGLMAPITQAVREAVKETRTAAKAEIERLRAALETILKDDHVQGWNTKPGQIARAALKGTGQ